MCRKRILLHCWWDCKLVQPLWKSIWRFLRKLEIDLYEDTGILLLGIHPKGAPTMPQGHVFHYVHSGLICDSQKLERSQMSLNRKMNAENVVKLHNRI
jgi:hypothetical protein